MNTAQVTRLHSIFLAVKPRFEQALAQAVAAIHQDGRYPAWVWKCADGLSAREQVAQTIANVYYQSDAMDGREVEVNPGLVPSSPTTLDAIEKLNLIKLELQQVLAELDRYGATQGRDNSFTRAILSDCGWSRFHRKQAVRQLPVVHDEIVKVGFIWAHTNDVQRISVRKAQECLEKLDPNPYIENQIRLTNNIPPNEILAVVKQSSLHIRANLLLNIAPNGLARKQVRSHVPLFFAYEKNKVLPPFAPPKESSEKDPRRLKRLDVKIEETPFLPTINVYRYLPEHRLS